MGFSYRLRFGAFSHSPTVRNAFNRFLSRPLTEISPSPSLLNSKSSPSRYSRINRRWYVTQLPSFLFSAHKCGTLQCPYLSLYSTNSRYRNHQTDLLGLQGKPMSFNLFSSVADNSLPHRPRLRRRCCVVQVARPWYSLWCGTMQCPCSS